MRIAVANWTDRKVGGTEIYLSTIIPQLRQAGHQVAFYSEIEEPIERARICIPTDSTSWCAAKIGVEISLAGLGDWRPDVIYCHKLADPILERRLIDLAPSVFFAHDYSGTCISGAKAFKFPNVQPCRRSFGWQCLLHYFPHRCGGLNPVTMLKLYSSESRRLENLKAYDAIVTHSDYMLAELIKHGLAPQRAYSFPYYAQAQAVNEQASDSQADSLPLPILEPIQRESGHTRKNEKAELTLLFLGRMEYLKGAHVLLDALADAQKALDIRLHVILAGDGRERRALEQRAARTRNEQVQIEFTGWIERDRLEILLANCDLLVLPSLWPEPFGLVGPEAGFFGVPVAAFDVGGIRDWLSDGVNGFLAPGTPPTSKGLANAIVKCLQDPETHAKLRDGAVQLAQRFSIQNHLSALLQVFSNVSGKDFSFRTAEQLGS